MKAIFLIFLVCVLSVGKASVISYDNTAEERITIKGIVKNAYSGNPIANATVLVKGGNGLGAITNADGEFSFSIAKSIYNIITLEITAKGYDNIVEYVNDIQPKKKVMLTVKMHKTKEIVELGNIIIIGCTFYRSMVPPDPLISDVDIMAHHYFGLSYWD